MRVEYHFLCMYIGMRLYYTTRGVRMSQSVSQSVSQSISNGGLDRVDQMVCIQLWSLKRALDWELIEPTEPSEARNKSFRLLEYLRGAKRVIYVNFIDKLFTKQKTTPPPYSITARVSITPSKL